ncbi:MAG: FAD binding domain-containing protein [Coprothermobacterota bacterium]|nr:FAD binding domain-containing protein [Coprothermobacterota bacterium]
MLKQVIDYISPTDLGEAVALLRQFPGEAALVGGGLDLSWRPRKQARVLIGLDRLALTYQECREEGLAIGATTTLLQIIESPLLVKYLGGFLPRVLNHVATPLLHGMITIGGALVRAYPWADLPCLFLGLEAQVILYDGADRLLSLADYYADRSLRGADGPLLREVLLPTLAGSRIAYQRFTRTAVDIPLLNQLLRIRWEGSRVAEAFVWLGARPGAARRVAEVETLLVGSSLTGEECEQAVGRMREQAEVESDLRLSADYRRHLAGVLLRRNLEEVADAA